MSYPLYDYSGLVLVNGGEYELNDLQKKCKTRSVRNSDGFTIRIEVSKIRISRRTNWRKSNYCRMFEDYDSNCFLCGYYGLWHSVCKCPESFSIEEQIAQVPRIRRNIVIWHQTKTASKEETQRIREEVELWSDQEVNDYLFTDEPDGCRVLKVRP